MPNITNWSGSVWGTNNGSVAAELVRDGQHIQGSVLLFEPGLGSLYAKVTGEWDEENQINLRLEQFTSNYKMPIALPNSGTLSGKYDSSEHLIVGQT